METETRCMGCMKPKGSQWICPHCGYRNKPRNPTVLPYQAVLNNKFLVGRILGKPGGFGVTYLAWDLVLHTTVAIKEYFPGNLATRSPDHNTVMFDDHKDKAQFDAGLEQFLREARALAQFSHPNIVRVREFFQQNNTAYLVMDYYEGISLEDFVQRKGGKISENLAVNLLLPILDGLSQVHQKKMLHRDIKPANIYLTKAGAAILLDFGAARFALGQDSQTISVILTAGFAPFEQYLEKAGELLGPWTDIYGYGATLYAVTTGMAPDNAINRHQRDMLLAPIQIVPALSPRFSLAVMAALALDPKQRPQTAQALQRLLLDDKAVVSDPQRQMLISQNISELAIDTEELAVEASTAAKPSCATQDEATIQEASTASENQAPTSTTEAKSNRFVYCPHCQTLNHVAAGQIYSRLKCRRCGKRITDKSEQDGPFMLNGKWLALIVVLLMIGGAVMKRSEKPAKLPEVGATSPQLSEPEPEQSAAPETAPEPESEPEQPSEPQSESAARDVTETSDIDASERQEESATVSDQEPVEPEPRFDAKREGKRHPGFFPRSWPPESALAGCRGKQRGDSCHDRERPGDTRGVCDEPPDYDGLVCVPLRRMK